MRSFTPSQIAILATCFAVVACGDKEPDTAVPSGEIINEDGDVIPPDDGDDGSGDGSGGGAGDADGDGFPAGAARGEDCDDGNPAINPDATDIIGDDRDQNCDGLDGTDVDADGQASAASGGLDCNDRDAMVFYGAADTAGDAVDADCDGVDGVDADGDGQASEASGGLDCNDGDEDVFEPDEASVDADGDGWTECAGDCDDDDARLFPFDSDEDGIEDLCGWRTVATGAISACAIDSGGEIHCWGWDAYGGLQSPAGSYVSLSAGPYNMCALDSGGRVACWGESRYGINSPPAGVFAEVELAGRFACGILTSGQVRCWGDDRTQSGRSGVTSPPTGIFHGIEVSGGVFDGYNDGTACALTPANRLTCWGLVGYNVYTGAHLASGGADIGADLARILVVGASSMYGFDLAGQYVTINRSCAGSGSSLSCSSAVYPETTGWLGWLHVGTDSENASCAIQADGEVVCAGIAPPVGRFRDIDAASWASTDRLVKYIGGADYGCGVTVAGLLHCFGQDLSLSGVLAGP
jgi:hypothetical protein